MKIVVVLCFIVGVYCKAAPGLYAVDGSITLVHMNATTGKVTQIAPIQKELQAEQLSCVDQSRGLLYMVGLNTSDNSKTNLFALQLEDGKEVFNMELPFPSETLVGVGESLAIDEQRNKAYILGPDPKHPTGQNWVVLSVDLSTKAVETLGSFARDIPVLGVASAYCPTSNIFWFPASVNQSGSFHIDLYGLNVLTKQTTKIEDQINTGPFAYDTTRKRLTGLGVTVKNSKFSRYLVEMDCHTGVVKQLGHVTDTYVIVNADLFAINEHDRLGYALLAAEKGPGKLGPMHLLSMNADTGNVTASPVAQDQIWSLHYYQG